MLEILSRREPFKGLGTRPTGASERSANQGLCDAAVGFNVLQHCIDLGCSCWSLRCLFRENTARYPAFPSCPLPPALLSEKTGSHPLLLSQKIQHAKVRRKQFAHTAHIAASATRSNLTSRDFQNIVALPTLQGQGAKPTGAGNKSWPDPCMHAAPGLRGSAWDP